MNPLLVLAVIAVYFFVLMVISYFTSKNANTETFFNANKQSPWYLVAFGMVGATLSGVTFISVPGWVLDNQFSYMQMVFGYLLGYAVIALVLMPVYYRLNLVSIYAYLDQRFGWWSHKSGAFFFLLSRTIGASFRLFLVALVLQLFLFDAWNVPFWATVSITIGLIYLYTFRGGIKTIVWTDTLQTLFILVAVILSIYLVASELNLSSLGEMSMAIKQSTYSKVFFWDFNSGQNFFKQFFSGAFMAIVMTGLDQDMMQKNLTCRNLKDAQKNMLWFSVTLVFVNVLFLSLGALLYMFAAEKGISIPDSTDQLYPLMARDHFNTFTGVVFLLGVIAAAYSSADSALTALTTSFCVDFLDFNQKSEKAKKKSRMLVHIGFALLIFLVVVVFHEIENTAVISMVFTVAGYTYGPLLGLYAFGLLTGIEIKDSWLVLLVCILAPCISGAIEYFSGNWFGFFILVVNGVLTFIGLLLLANFKAAPLVDSKNAFQIPRSDPS